MIDSDTLDNIEEIPEETNDDYVNDDLYNINSWGADYSFRELISMYQDGDLVKPELQRKYVWGKPEASRFVDSVLLGLPRLANHSAPRLRIVGTTEMLSTLLTIVGHP